MKILKLLFFFLFLSNVGFTQVFNCNDYNPSTIATEPKVNEETCEVTIKLAPDVPLIILQEVLWTVNGEFFPNQQQIVIPLCKITEDVLDINLSFLSNSQYNCSYDWQYSVKANCIKDCDFTPPPPPPTDCQASFTTDYNVANCSFDFANTSTPSATNDCGECVNPSGIISSTWRLKDFAAGSPGIGTLNLVDHGFHFDFRPKEYPVQYGYHLCLTIVDCAGCESTHCEFLEDRLPKCQEFTGNPEEGLSEYKGKDQEHDRSGFSLYPNPTSNEVYIDLTNTDETANQSEILVYDLQGKQIQIINTTAAAKEQLDVSNWATGTYLFVLKSDGKVIQTKKLNIQTN